MNKVAGCHRHTLFCIPLFLFLFTYICLAILTTSVFNLYISLSCNINLHISSNFSYFLQSIFMEIQYTSHLIFLSATIY